MFIRIFRPREGKEVLLNVDHITKIEVEYAVPGSEGSDWKVDLNSGAENPETLRWNKVHVGGEVLTLRSDPHDPVVKVIEDIYKNAIKG